MTSENRGSADVARADGYSVSRSQLVTGRRRHLCEVSRTRDSVLATVVLTLPQAMSPRAGALDSVMRIQGWPASTRINYGGMLTQMAKLLLPRAILLALSALLLGSAMVACGSNAASLLPLGTTRATLRWINSGVLGPNTAQPIGGEVAGKRFKGTAIGSGNCPERATGTFDNMKFHGTSVCVGPDAFSHYLITGKVGGEAVTCNLLEHTPSITSARHTFNLSCTTDQGLHVTSAFQMTGGNNPINITLHVTS